MDPCVSEFEREAFIKTEYNRINKLQFVGLVFAWISVYNFEVTYMIIVIKYSKKTLKEQ